MNDKTKIYIMAPSESNTGGVESLHQLAAILNNNHFNAFICYYGKKKLSIDKKFEKYNVKIVSEIEDSKFNILIVPETLINQLYKYSNIQKCIWWLSLDYYLYLFPFIRLHKGLITLKEYSPRISFILAPLLYIPLVISDKLRRRKRTVPIKKDKKKNEYIHFYNCDYIKNYLLEKNIYTSKMKFLCGPIRDEFLSNKNIIKLKKNIVLYNPNKGIKFTKKIIKNVNERKVSIQFIPIKSMLPDQVIKTFQTAKVYIDFGFFPGPERMPREAVSCYCNIITSKEGSAKNNTDIKISESYKIEKKRKNIPLIGDLICELVMNYEAYLSDFEEYRKKVKTQCEEFEIQVVNYFEEIINNNCGDN